MKLKKGDVFKAYSNAGNPNNPMSYLYCGKLDNGLKLLFEIDCYKNLKKAKIKINRNVFHEASIHTYNFWKKIEYVKNIGEEKADKYMKKYMELLNE